MIDFLMRVFPALFFLMFYRRLSTSAKKANSGSYEGMSVRLPKALHHLLYPGARWEKKPLFSVVSTAASLIGIFAILVLSVWITFFLNVDQTEKAFIYRHAIASILYCFILALGISWIMIFMHKKSLHIAIRVAIIVLTVICLIFIEKPFVASVIRLIRSA